jgi:hypothetical protein
MQRNYSKFTNHMDNGTGDKFWSQFWTEEAGTDQQVWTWTNINDDGDSSAYILYIYGCKKAMFY